MERHDVIIIGSGMGGLSTAAFLSLAGVKTAIFEQHDKPGGYVTSFRLHDIRFDAGLESLPELAPGDILDQFLTYWDVQLPLVKREENIRVFTNNGDYRLHAALLPEDLAAAFPAEKQNVKNILSLNRRIMEQLRNSGAPKPPYEMSPWEKIIFGMQSLVRKPALLQFGLKNALDVLKKYHAANDLGAVLMAKIFYNIVYLSCAYRWEQIRQMRGFYPLGGMQALADAVATSITRRGGKLFLKHGIKKIIVDKNRAAGIEDDTGTPHYADIIISNAPLPYTVENLLAEAPGMEHLLNRIRRRRIFPAAFLVFTGIDAGYNFHEYNYLTSAPSYQNYKSLSLKPEEVPFAFFLSSDYEGGKIRPAVLMAPLPYEYGNCWASGPGRIRNEEYRAFKNSIADILLKRLGRHLGAGFQDAVKFAVAATPLTFERYTNNASGSFMGFSIQQGEYGNFFAQESPVKNLYCAGQWVFPGFGVSGTAAGGYYCARSILRNQGISLDKILQESAGT